MNANFEDILNWLVRYYGWEDTPHTRKYLTKCLEGTLVPNSCDTDSLSEVERIFG